MKKLLSIIIVTYQSEKDIFDCLASIYQYNDIGDGLEVIIVDNNSPSFDSTKTQIQQLYPSVKILLNTQNGGYGQGNNIGIQAATAPLIAILNPDVRLIMPLFQSVINMFDNPQLGMVGCKQMQNSQKAGPSFQYIANASGFEKCILALLRNKFNCYDSKRMYLSGAFFFVRKDLMDAIGGFDEQIFMYAEEDDIRFRLLQHNPNLQFIYRKDLTYIHPTDNRDFNESRERRQIESNIYVIQKQGFTKQQYIQSELNRCRWNILLLGIVGHFQSIKLLNNILRILKSYK